MRKYIKTFESSITDAEIITPIQSDLLKYHKDNIMLRFTSVEINKLQASLGSCEFEHYLEEEEERLIFFNHEVDTTFTVCKIKVKEKDNYKKYYILTVSKPTLSEIRKFDDFDILILRLNKYKKPK